MKVRPGQQYDTMFYARNDGKRTIVGNAVPSIAPARTSGYFSKTECFCFTAQTLAAGEARDMPVRSEEHTSELQSLMRTSYAVFCLKKKKKPRSESKESHQERLSKI